MMYETIQKLTLDKMSINLNLFTSLMESEIFSYLNSIVVIKKCCIRYGNEEMKISKNVLKPQVRKAKAQCLAFDEDFNIVVCFLDLQEIKYEPRYRSRIK